MGTRQQRDDRQLFVEPGGAVTPLRVAVQFGCLASVLLVILTELGLVVLMVAGKLPWQGWLYVAAPLTLWVLLLGLPVLYKSHRVTLGILNVMLKTIEAYLARAGWVIDLNRDGHVGFVQPQITPPRVVENRPLLVNAPLNAAVLGHDVEAVVQGAAGAESIPGDDTPELRVWACPGQRWVAEDTLVEFVEGMFTKGLSRGRWVPPMEREDYDAVIALLEQARLIEGRKPGHAGRVVSAVRSARQARGVLGLPAG